uniref:Ig-like domain-containing protein n=1 Tax=Moschus moschiferus TaxID=68415 RepID=A0A8C6CZ95_MOSMO
MEMHVRSFLVVLWLHFCCKLSGKNQVEQSPPSLVVLEGENCTFQCNYTVSPFNHLRWYTQDTGRGFVHLILMRSNERQKYSGRLHFTLDNSIKSSSLSITASQVEDSATYLCALDTQCSAGTRSPSANLPELSLRSRNSVQSWWFCLPTKESLQMASNTNGSSSQIPEFS